MGGSRRVLHLSPQKFIKIILHNFKCTLLAHARLMFRDTVTLEDAITVVSVMESSMQVRIFCT